jgi:enoyl-[acyl-carrier protein] reductase/trans-2-enoyl-CoA reductase (NAD+)
VKRQTLELIKADLPVDLVIYSLASPVRLDPKTGVLHRSFKTHCDTFTIKQLISLRKSI